MIATYNRPDELDRVLAGLADQAVPPLEVVVVDDESTPPAQPTFPDGVGDRWRCIRQPNGGPGKARDTGIRDASGDVIIIVDDDMIVTPRLVAAHLEQHAAGYDVVQGRFDNLSEGSQPLHDAFLAEQQRVYFEACENDPSAVEPARLSTGNVSFRRTKYLECGGFDTSMRRREDSDLGLRFAETGARFGYAPERTAMHDEPGEPLAAFLREGYEYGESELAIHTRHPDSYRPWDLVDEMPGSMRLLIRLLSRWPKSLALVGRVAGWVGTVLERLRLTGPAVQMYGAGFALHWFSGMIAQLGGRPFLGADAAAVRPDADRIQVDFEGVRIDVVDVASAVNRIVELSRLDRSAIVVTPNVDHLVLCREVPAFRRTYDRADLILADGMPIVMLTRLLRLPLRHKVSGSDLVMPLLRAAAAHELGVYILGTTEDAADEAIAKLDEQIPHLSVVGRSSPWFKPGADNPDMVKALDDVRATGADLVLVAFGSPKEGQLLDQYWDDLPPACFLACGASIDFIAGRVPRAPEWLSKVGLEWVFRLVNEPKRLWKRYLVQDVKALPIFIRVAWRRVRGVDSSFSTTPSTCAILATSLSVVLPSRILSLPSPSRLRIPAACAALRMSLTVARLNAISRISAFIFINSYTPRRPRYPVSLQRLQPMGL